PAKTRLVRERPGQSILVRGGKRKDPWQPELDTRGLSLVVSSELALDDAVLESLPLGLGEAQDRAFTLVLGVTHVDVVTLEGDLDTRTVCVRPGRLTPAQLLRFHSSATS